MKRLIILLFIFFPIFIYTQSGAGIKYKDSFNALNESFWVKSRGTFKNNLAYFHPDNVNVKDNKLELVLENDKKRKNRYLGAQLKSKEKFSYGKYEIKVKPAKGDGLINAIFLMGTSVEIGHEIDMEFMGKHSDKLLTNYWDKDGNEFPKMIKLGFDASKEYHTYAFEWTQESITWYVDGNNIRSVKKRIPDEPMHLYINLWVSIHDQWAGVVDRSKLPLKAYFDEFKIYKLE